MNGHTEFFEIILDHTTHSKTIPPMLCYKRKSRLKGVKCKLQQSPQCLFWEQTKRVRGEELPHQKVGKEFLSKPQEEVMMHAFRNTPRGMFYSGKSQGKNGSPNCTSVVIPNLTVLVRPRGKYSFYLSIAQAIWIPISIWLIFFDLYTHDSSAKDMPNFYETYGRK